jgi:CubicO group peptidase (beta-lactamase class C family)
MQHIDRRRLIAAAAAGVAWAAAPRAFARTAGRYQALEALLDGWVAQGRVSGAALAIVRPGRFAPDYLFAGRTAFEGGQPVSARTLWRIYSMTKPVTGVAAIQRVAAGRITLDTPVGESLPGWSAMRVAIAPDQGLEARPAERPVRLRHLLTHTAGLTYTIVGDGPLEREYRRLGIAPTGSLALRPGDTPAPDLQTMCARLATLPLRTEPGTAYRYSVALDVAGGLLERLAGAPLDAVLERQLFAPLGMRDTGWWVGERDRPRLAAAYGWQNPATGQMLDKPVRVDGPERSDYDQKPVLLAGGAGLVSTVADYARFAQMLLNEGQFDGRTIMPRGAARLAMSNLLEPGVYYEGNLGYGAGGQVTLADTRATSPAGRPPGVFGWSGAAGTRFHVDPVRQYAMVLMVQYLPPARFPIADELQAGLNAVVEPAPRA